VKHKLKTRGREIVEVSKGITTSKPQGESTSIDGRTTIAGAQDQGAMHPDIVDLQILNLAEIRRLFEIKT
jgi:hypothetical protein